MSRRRRTPLGARMVPVATDIRGVALTVAAPGTRVVAPPDVPTATVPLESCATVVELTDPDPPVTVVDGELRPGVDVLPTALVAPVPVQRARDLALRPVVAHAAALPTAAVRLGTVALDRPAVRRSAPDALLEVRLRPTPPERIDPERLRRCLVALLRRSGVTSAADLTLVGVFDRVPGGAVRTVTPVDGGVRLRLRPGGRRWPATLVVGRRRSTGRLVTVELPAIGDVRDG